MALGLIGAGLLGAGGSIAGSLIGKDSAEEAAKMQLFGTNAANNALSSANRFAQEQYQPYSNYGLNALPFLQSGIMGLQPEYLSEDDLAQLQGLQGSFDYGSLAGGTIPGWGSRDLAYTIQQDLGEDATLQQVSDWLNSRMDQAGSSQNTRHWGEAFGPAQAQVNRQMQQLEDLKRRQQIQQVYEQTGEDGQPTVNQFIPTMEREQGYVNALENLQNQGPSLDSPMYQAKQRELERTLNRKYAGMGNMYSSSADDAMLRNQGGLMEQEYGRQYGGLTDLYNLQSGISGRKYGQFLDAAKIGAGAAGQAGQSSLATAGQMGSNYLAGANAQAQGTLAAGNAMSNMWSNLGALPMQGMALNNQMKANNALAKYYGG